MLKQLELNFFKKHERLSVNFTAGLNGITGPNYKGKSTILLGILFCLGGSRMVPGTRIATRGTNTGFKQTLWFEIPGKGDFMVQRTKTSANLHRLTEDGTHLLVASGTSPVNNAISELLGMPLRRFAQIKYAKQKAADAILKAGSTELFKIVTELTGLERITAVLGLLDNDIRVQRGVADALTVVDVEPKLAELRDMREMMGSLQAALGELSTRVFSAVNEVERAEQETRRLSDARNAVLEGQREVRYAAMTHENCDSRLIAVNDRLKALWDDMSKLCDDGQTLEDWIAGRVQEHENLSEIERGHRALSVEVATLTREDKGLTATLDELQEAVEKADGKLSLIAPVNAEEAAKVVEGLKKLHAARPETAHKAKHAQAVLDDGVCSSCNRPVDDFDPHQAAMEAGFWAASLRDLDTKIEILTQQSTENAKKQSTIDRLKDERQRKRVALEDLQSHAAKLRQTLKEKVDKLAVLEAIAPPASYKEELAALSQGLEAARTLQRNIKAAMDEAKVAEKDVGVSEAAYNGAQIRYQELLREYDVESPDEVSSRLEDQQLKLDQARLLRDSLSEQRHLQLQNANKTETRITLLEQEVAQAVTSNERHEESRLKAVSMEQLRELIRSNRDRYSRQVWDVFMASASLFANTITGGYMESVSRGSDGQFTFFEEGFEMALEEASGAQQALIGCAVQMALAEAAQCPLDVVLMDEPTADMDPEHALAFSTLLAASGKQVVLVTHRELDASVFSHSIAL